MAIVKNDWTNQIRGSVFTTSSSDAIKPPTGSVFVGFTVLAAATFDASGGLVADPTPSNIGNIPVYAQTEDASNDLAAGSETILEGSGGVQITNSNATFPAGCTIHGRYTEIDVAGGAIIAYIGK